MLTLNGYVILVGLGMGIIIFAIFLYAILPFLLTYATDEWESVLQQSFLTEEEVRKYFKEHPAYITMHNMYPNATEIKNDGKTEVTLELAIMNKDNNQSLTLLMTMYKESDNYMEINAFCENTYGESFIDANGAAAIEFIKKTDCLTMDPSGLPGLPHQR